MASWKFPPNRVLLGAIDGQHIMIDCPSNAGSAYYNYKSFHSVYLFNFGPYCVSLQNAMVWIHCVKVSYEHYCISVLQLEEMMPT